MADLGTAEDKAATLGSNVISNSWGTSSDLPDSVYGKYWNHPGHISVFSSGDTGYGVHYPASSRYVTAVGGTTLTKDSGVSRGWNETVWSGTGSGCSTYNTEPKWQKANSLHNTGCSMRTSVDVAADANPATGVALYDGYGYAGWLEAGGTSVAVQIIGGIYGLAGNGSAVIYGSYPYAHAGSLFDITVGSDGTCKTAYLCTARQGYDGPTGLGAPNGYMAF